MHLINSLLCLICILNSGVQCHQHSNHFKKRASSTNPQNTILKKLTPVEIFEDVPIGHTIIDLKETLAKSGQHHDDPSTTSFYYNFEFLNNLNDKFSSDVSGILKTHSFKSIGKL